ncbi:hypothetical protein CP532_0741 [Ophiocordyceps camponoti-leonardi (nom. inval.)]|nr:hypothetical protein CP532_0741 [Ophiocordyceps camponoti-leonardi (nom. inval.)]
MMLKVAAVAFLVGNALALSAQDMGRNQVSASEVEAKQQVEAEQQAWSQQRVGTEKQTGTGQQIGNQKQTPAEKQTSTDKQTGSQKQGKGHFPFSPDFGYSGHATFDIKGSQQQRQQLYQRKLAEIYAILHDMHLHPEFGTGAHHHDDFRPGRGLPLPPPLACKPCHCPSVPVPAREDCRAPTSVTSSSESSSSMMMMMTMSTMTTMSDEATSYPDLDPTSSSSSSSSSMTTPSSSSSSSSSSSIPNSPYNDDEEDASSFVTPRYPYTTASTSTSSTPSSSTTPPIPKPSTQVCGKQTCGSHGVKYNRYESPFAKDEGSSSYKSSFDIAYFQDKKKAGDVLDSGLLNDIYIESDYANRSYTDAAVEYRTYLYTCEGGTYNFTSTQTDDVAFMWFGDEKVSNPTAENADIFQTNYVNRRPRTVQRTIEKGQYYPILVIWANSQGAGYLNLDITGPDGEKLSQRGKVNEQLLADKCDDDDGGSGSSSSSSPAPYPTTSSSSPSPSPTTTTTSSGGDNKKPYGKSSPSAAAAASQDKSGGGGGDLLNDLGSKAFGIF